MTVLSKYSVVIEIFATELIRHRDNNNECRPIRCPGGLKLDLAQQP